MLRKIERHTTLLNKHGLHARPISQIVELALRHSADLNIVYEGRSASARSILEMMTLGAGPGATLKLEALGEDADALVEEICALIARKFGES